MPGFLDLPVEIRNHVYDLLLWEELKPQSRGVMVVKEYYVKRDLPLPCYRGLLSVCRQIYFEFKQGIQHIVASKQLDYSLTTTFSHGRPFFSLEWSQFPALSPTINHLYINVDLRIREPFSGDTYRGRDSIVPHDHELAHLLEDSSESFAGQLFDYIAILLKAFANLLAAGNPDFGVLYTESMTLNLRKATSCGLPVAEREARRMHTTMQNTLKATSKEFKAFDAEGCSSLFPLIQVGSLRFATEGQVWAEGHNLVLAYDNFKWLTY
jgi:hypothetical protein